MTKFAYICCLILFSCCLFGQDFKSDFKKINQMYNSSDFISMDLKYELYLDGSNFPSETEVGKYLKDKKKYYNKQAGNEMIITTNYMFVIDYEAKILAVDKKIDENKIINPLDVNLDSLYLLYSKVEPLNTKTPEIKGYRFFIKEGPYSICEILFSVKTNFVTEIKNVFRDKIVDENGKSHSALLRTTFFNSTTKAYPISVFEEKNYIIKKDQKFVLTGKFKSFKFINHLK